MTTTPNLKIAHMSGTDTGKPTEVNNAISQFDTAYNSGIAENLTLSTFTMPSADFENNLVFIFTGSLSGSTCAITLPSTVGRMFVVINECTGPGSVDTVLTIKVGTSLAVVVISDANPHLLYTDGANSVYQAS